MTDKNKKLSMIILAALCVVLAVALVVVLLVKPGNDAQVDNTAGPEVGTYYFDAGHQEYTLTLNEGCRFTLYVKGGTESGSYTLSNNILTLDFSADTIETIEASMENSVVTLTYNNATMRFLKKVTYNVSFESNGGSTLETLSVLNGKSFAQPNDPVRDGFVFVGWYVDSEFKAPFAFQADPVTSDITLYARWCEKLQGGVEYTVDFDANYEGAENPISMTTFGGKLFSLPAITREGYEFKGWWVSVKENGNELSYRYEAGMQMDANMTLYALWQGKEEGNKLSAPVVNVGTGSLSWDAVAGARSYTVTVIGPDGEVMINNEPTSATTFNVPFDSYEAGMLEIRVTALANTGEENNSEAVRYINNKALGKVSAFEVIDSVLIFNTVENAQKYLITVVCGNPDHNHTQFDNGTSRTFNFANCTMTEDGIRFIVTAQAEGYGESVSREFVYRRDLNAVEGLRYDEATQTVFWNEVPHAAYYMVSVQCGNSNHSHEFYNNGSKTYVSLKECEGCEGGIVVKVIPKTNGYNTPAASEIIANKTGLATPTDLRVVGTQLTWTAVNGAAEYEVQVGDQVYKVTETKFDLSEAINWVAGSEYAVSVRALGDDSSLWSDVRTMRYGEMNDGVRYDSNTLYWQDVIGATGYEVQINDGPIISIKDGSTALNVKLTQAGVNQLKVRHLDGTTRSEWTIIEVYAHTVTFDTRGGSYIDVMYVAVGDRIQLPTTEKNSYDFVAWYNVPGGPAANGMAYTDEIFMGSGSIVLYAYYTPSKFTVTYNYGVGGTGEKESDLVSYENHYQLTVPTANTDGTFFGGWFSAPYGMGVQYTDARGNSLNPWYDEEGATVYAFWIDLALEFTLTKVAGVDAYIVTAGPQIALLDEITIPATYNGLPVSMVGGNAFMDCTSLRVINLPASLYQISIISPFGGCTKLEAVNVYPVDGINNPRYWSENGVLYDNGTGTVAQPKMQFLPMAKTGVYHIPNVITEIPERTFAGAQLTKVIIPSSVTKIGNEAFVGCEKLTSVVFESDPGEKPLIIGTRAFKDCKALEKIVLPARLESINLTKYMFINGEISTTDTQNSFAGCDSLTSITVAPGSNYFKSVDGVLYSADGKTLVYCPTTLKGSFTIPNGVIAVANGAFIDCDSLTEVSFPNTVTLVGECAFFGLKDSLTKISFAGGYNDVVIDKYAFRDCAALHSVVFEKNSRISTLEEGAFYGCAAITSIEFPAALTKIGANAFYQCYGLQSIIFAENGKTLAFGENAFMECTSLTSVDLPAYVTEIPGVFGGCSSLEAVNVAENSPYLTSIDGVVFNKSVTEILFFPQGRSTEYYLPETVTSIASGVFSGVKKLKKLHVSNSITNIGEQAFKEAAITSILFEGEVFGEELVIGASAFEGATIGKLKLPRHTTVISDRAFAKANASEIQLNEGIVSLGNEAFRGATVVTKMSIPTTVKTMGEYCFAAETNSPNVELPAVGGQLESISNYAFYKNTKIKTINIPATVTSIGAYAFADCTAVTELNFEANSSLKIIDGHAFQTCGGSYGGKLKTVTIPKSVTSIGAYAFESCDFESVYFEEGGTEDLVIGAPFRNVSSLFGSVTVTIEHGYAFKNCDNLVTLQLPSRLTEIGPYSFYGIAYYDDDGIEISFGEDSRLTTIGDYAFYSSNLKSIVIPKSVRNLDPVTIDEMEYTYDRLGIGHNAFGYNYSTLTSVVFEKGGTEPLTIGKSAFYNAKKLTSVELPARLAPYTSYTGEVYGGLANGNRVFEEAIALESVTVEAGGQYYLEKDGMVYTTDLTELILCPAGKTGSVEIPGSVTYIHDRAFYASQLEQITFVGGTEPLTIGSEAFSKAVNLKNIVFPTNLVSLGSQAFKMGVYDESALETITLPKTLRNFDGGMVENCNALKAIYVEDGSNYYMSDSGVLYSADKTRLITYPSNREGTTYSVLPGVLVIEANAFMGNSHLQTLELPDGLVEIREKAFADCESLESVCIPNTVELIDGWAFSNCYSLRNLSFQMGSTTKMIVGKYAFQAISTRDLVLPASMMVVADCAFIRTSLQNLSFEEGSKLYSLGDQVFQASALENVVLPDGLTIIGNGNFYGCTNLVSVTFGEGLSTMGIETFKDSNVQYVHLSASLQTLATDTFSGCSNLVEVTFAPFSQMTVIPEGAFADCGLARITIPASVKEIADAENKGAFHNCQNLVSVTFAEGSTIQKIGMRAFYECVNLKDFKIPVTVGTLGESAFEGCESLERIEIPANCTSLGGTVFSSCFNLSEVVLNTKTTELPGWLFANCHKLKEITIPVNVSSIGRYCFINSGLEAVYVDPANSNFVSVDGVLFTKDKSQVVIYPMQKKDAAFVVPSEVTLIINGIFNECDYLKEIIFEDGELPLEIDDEAFYGSDSLIRVELPERLASIGEGAFSHCYNLMFVNVPATATKDMFGREAFSMCGKLLEIRNESSLDIKAGSQDYGYLASNALNVYNPAVGQSQFYEDENGYITFQQVDGGRTKNYLVAYVGESTELNVPAGVTHIYKSALNGSMITKLVLPEGVLEIEDSAFAYCDVLTEVMLPSTLKTIGNSAFYGCTTLSQIVIPSGVTTIGTDAFDYCSQLTILAEVAKKPAGWDAYWTEQPVFWSYDGAEHTYTFVTNGEEIIDPVLSQYPVQLPVIAREGYVFMGWYDNAEFDGNQLKGNYYSPEKTTLYAKWMTEQEYADSMGVSYDKPMDLEMNGTIKVNISVAGQKVYVRVYVSESMWAKMYTDSAYRVDAYHRYGGEYGYDSTRAEHVAYIDEYGSYIWLEAGYNSFEFYAYDGVSTGEFEIELLPYN